MRKSAALPLAFMTLSALVAAAAGCSGNGGSSATSSATAAPIASPTAICTAPPNYTIQMVFPIPGSTAAANLQGVVFAVSPNPLPTNWYFYVTQTAGSVGYTTYGTAQIGFLSTPGPGPSPTTSPATTATASPTPLPTPSASSVAGSVFEAASIGTFATNTSFNVFLANSNCTPAVTTASLVAPTAGPASLYYGSFTTATVDTPTPTPTPTST